MSARWPLKIEYRMRLQTIFRRLLAELDRP